MKRSLRPIVPRAPALAAVLLGLLCGKTAYAQVVLDPDFSSDTISAGEYAPGQNTDYLVRESYGRRAGDNLFHRFSRFDIPTGESATFVEDAPGSGIRRVISYVGGSSASRIDGVLRSTIPNADLFLYNARGVVFGPNARLDVAGAFHTSTAEFMRFADGVRFGEVETGAAVTLSAAAPSAWGFLSATPAEIAVEGARLAVPTNSALSLVGGSLRIEGPGTTVDPTLSAPSGALRLASLGSPGEVSIAPSVAPDLAQFVRLGDITLSNGAVLDASGVDDQTLVMLGDSLFIDNASIFANHLGPADHPGRAVNIDMRGAIRFGDSNAGSTARLRSMAFREEAPGGGPGPDVGDGGEVRIRADSFTLEGSGTLLEVGNECADDFPCSQANQPGGDGGALEIDVDRFALRNGAIVAVQSFGPGTGSSVTIRAREVDIGNDPGVDRETALLSGSLGSFVPGTAPPEGENARGGDLKIIASERVVLEDGGLIRTTTQQNGRGGDIRITTGHFETIESDPAGTSNLSGVVTDTDLARATDLAGGEGRAGDIVIVSTGDLHLENGFVSSAARTTDAGLPRASGSIGDITLRALDGTINIGRRGTVNSQISVGAGSKITLEANRLRVQDGGVVQATVASEGTAGDILVRADDILLSGGGGASGARSGLFSNPLSASDSGSGSGGSIQIDGDRLRIEDGATISLSSIQFGAVGDLVVGTTAPLSSVVLQGSSIEAETSRESVTGGDITINADQILIDRASRISSTNIGQGDAGTISLNGRSLEVLRESEIETAAGARGVGGNVTVHMNDSVVIDHSRISTDTRGATPTTQGGNIDFESQVVILSAAALDASAPVGAGGRIQIVAGRFLSTPSTILDASGGVEALNGIVQILSSETNTQNAIPRPPVVIEDATNRLAMGCESRTDALGSLYVLPRPLDPAPGARLASDARAFDALARDAEALLAEIAGSAEPTSERVRWRLQSEAKAIDRAIVAGPLTPSERIQLQLHLGRSLARLSRTGAARGEAAAAARLHAVEIYLRIVAATSEGTEPTPRQRFWAEGELARLYLDEGHKSEALRLARRAYQAASSADDTLARFRFGRVLAAALEASGDRAGALETLRRTARLGESLRRDRVGRVAPELSSSGESNSASIQRPPVLEDDEFTWPTRRLLSLLLDDVEASEGSATQALLHEVRDLLETQRSAELEDYFGDACLQKQDQTVPDAIPGALVLYPILLDDRVALLTGFEGHFAYHRAPTTSAGLRDHAREFRRLLEKRTTRQYLRPAQHLYDALVRPIESQIEAGGVDALVIVPDGLLRTIPFAALYDRERQRFLIDLAPIALVPSLRLTQPSPLARGQLSVLAAGLEEATSGFARLDHTRDEIERMRERFPGSRVLFDEEFEIDALANEIRTRPYSIVHLATHGRVAADGSESFLVAHDGRLGLDRMTELISTTRFRRDRPLELLTLSACETAAGDERAALGLAGVAVRAGARSALATLWPVNDEATAELIDDFYAELEKPEQSRAGALRAAQLRVRETPRFAHPGYWAPFLMISSWL